MPSLITDVVVFMKLAASVLTVDDISFRSCFRKSSTSPDCKIVNDNLTS